MGFGLASFGLGGGAGLSSGLPASPITDLFNGFDARGTFVGGPTQALDNLGVLQTSPAGVLPLQGGRLSYSLAEGATLGPELVVNGGFDTSLAGWVISNSSAQTVEWVAGKLHIVSNGAATDIDQSIVGIGKTYQVGVTGWNNVSGVGKIQLGAAGTSYNPPNGDSVSVHTNTGSSPIFYVAREAACEFYVDGISVKEVIPIWLPTAANGSPLWPSQSIRTRKGNVQKYPSEASATNLFLKSSLFGDAVGWIRTRAVITPAAAIAPDGTLTAQKITSDGTGSGYAYQSIPFTAGQAYTLSVYVKPISTPYVNLTSFTQSGLASFTLTGAGTIGALSGIATGSTLIALPNGWYRCTATFVANATASNNIGAPVGTYNGDMFYVWGAQLETGVFASSYIPTDTVAVTRPASILGYLNEPARTNILWNSASGMGDTFAVSAQTYTLSMIGSGSITLSGVAVGVATASAPLTFTPPAGTLTLTPAGSVLHKQLEVGAFKTSPIVTLAAPATRPASNYTRLTAGGLRGNDFGVWGRVIPSAGGQGPVYVFGAAVDGANTSGIAVTATQITFNKYISGVNQGGAAVMYSHTTIPFEYLFYQSSVYGWGLKIKQDGGAWVPWQVKSDDSGKLPLPLPSMFQIGGRGGILQMSGNFPFTLILQSMDPKAELEKLAAKYP